MNHSALVFLAFLTIQQFSPPPSVVSDYYQAHNDGRYADAAAKREEARQRLQQAPFDGNQTVAVYNLYQNAGLTSQARSVLEDGLERSEKLGDSDPGRMDLFRAMAQSWMQERNRLKAILYWEKLAAAMEAPPRPAAAVRPAGPIFMTGGWSRLGAGQDVLDVYQQLAQLYREVARPDAAAAIVKKMRARSPNGDLEASYRQRIGQLDDAAEIYKAQIEKGASDAQANAWQRLQPIQNLASIYERQGRLNDAIATMQQAVAAIDGIGTQESLYQAIGVRQHLATLLTQAGQLDAAEAIYRQLFADVRDDQNHQGFETSALTSYAGFLSSTKRSGQAEKLLNAFLTSHNDLQPWQQANVLYALAAAADSANDAERAAKYRNAAQEAQRPQTPPETRVMIAPDIDAAQQAASKEQVEVALTLAIRAIDKAPHAADRDQIAWGVSAFALQLASAKSTDVAIQLQQRLISLLQNWSVDNTLPLQAALDSYCEILTIARRWDDVPAALDRYQAALVAAHGAQSGFVVQGLQKKLRFAQAREDWAEAIAAAQEMAALEESLSGKAGEMYLAALNSLAESYQAAGDPGRELPVRSEAILVADAAYPLADARRGWARVNAAMALARDGKFDEAERLVREALEIERQLQPPQPNLFEPEAEQIRQMKDPPKHSQTL